MVSSVVDILVTKNGKSYTYFEFTGLSTDIKPIVNVYNGSKFTEMDTGTIYQFDQPSLTWRKHTGEAGGIKKKIVDVLPEVGEDDVLYFILNEHPTETNRYAEYMWIQNKWEWMGNTGVDLTDYYTKEEVDAMVKTQEYKQMSASSTWVIEHNMDKHPSVTIVDSGGNEVVGDVVYIDNNKLKVIFSSAFSGTAYLN